MAYVWTHAATGIEYVVFAASEEAAKATLRKHYKAEELESALFRSSPRVEPMPDGFVFFSKTTWLTKHSA